MILKLTELDLNIDISLLRVTDKESNMAIDSKYLRYREAGEQANVNNVEEFGVPEKSLFTTTQFLSLHHHIDITDENGNVVYQAESDFPSIHDKTDIVDAEGNFVAHIERQLLSLHYRHFVTMADGTAFQISSEFWHLIKDVVNIEELGWQIQGNIAALNFRLFDQDGGIIAVISQKFISLHDKYCIDIYRTDLEQTVIAILVTLQHINKDKEASSTASSSAASAG